MKRKPIFSIIISAISTIVLGIFLYLLITTLQVVNAGGAAGVFGGVLVLIPTCFIVGGIEAVLLVITLISWIVYIKKNK